MKPLSYLLIALTLLLTFACKTQEKNYDAAGTFEAEETIISAEASGVIKQFNVEEGQQLSARQFIGYIDSTQLHLKRLQLQAQIKAALSRKPNVNVQLEALREQLKAAERDKERFTNLYNQQAATKKQVDDITTQVEVLKRQIAAQQSQLGTTTESITQDTNPLQIQIEQTNDQLAKCRLTNPFAGTVLTKYAEVNELATVGKPLYKIASLDTLTLRAYITGDHLSQVKLNQQVNVTIDMPDKGSKQYSGLVTWISDKAEFTPKTIQTKDERANLVYAMKVKVKNDGALKLGMYGEVKLTNQ